MKNPFIEAHEYMMEGLAKARKRYLEYLFPELIEPKPFLPLSNQALKEKNEKTN